MHKTVRMQEIEQEKLDGFIEILTEAIRRLRGEFPAYAEMEPKERLETVQVWLHEMIEGNLF